MKRKTYKNNNNAPKTAKKQEPYTAKQKQFLAYVLAFAMVFWTIASVLGIVGFVKTCKADNLEASASTLSAVAIKETSTASNLEQTIDLQVYGVSVPVGLSSNERTFSRSKITFTSQRGGYPYVSIDGVKFYFSPSNRSNNFVGDYYGYDYQGQAINGDYDGVVHYVDEHVVMGVSSFMYRPPMDYDRGLYIDSVAVDVEVMETATQPLSYTWQYQFTFGWYTFDGTYKGDTQLVIGFAHNSELSYEPINIVYPSLSKTYYNAEDDIDTLLRFGTFSYADIRYSYNLGYDGGYNLGYDGGYSDGETIGYNRGYAEGADDAGEYTFMSLLTSVIDAPIKAITQMFEFEVLGVNLANFFWSLISVAAVICVIRLFV